MRRKLQTRIILFFVGLLLAVLLCEVIFNRFLSQQVFTMEQKLQMEELFSEIKDGYSDDEEELKEILKSMGRRKNIRVQITDGQNMIYTTVHRESRKLYNEKTQKLLGIRQQFYLEEPEARLVERKSDTVGRKIRLTGKFTYHGETRYVLLVYYLSSMEDITRLFTKTSILIAVMVMAAGAGAAVLFTKKLLLPLQEMEQAAHHISNLEFSYPAPTDTKIRELDSLSLSINKMSDKLSDFIKELKEANEQLLEDVKYQKQLEEMRRNFISNVSHEMKTPLFLLLMYSENLKEDSEGVDRDFYCDTIMEEALRLDKMVKSMLDMSSIENGLSKIQREFFDFSAFTKECIEKMQVIMKHADVLVEIEEGIQGYGDLYYLEQAMENFISNAVSYTMPGKKIKIQLQREAGKIKFSVWNEGEPIPEEKLPHIWESFYQVEESRTRKEEQSHVGLGLYIVKTIVNVHEGRCGAQNVDGGVCFWFSIPKKRGSLENQ